MGWAQLEWLTSVACGIVWALCVFGPLLGGLGSSRHGVTRPLGNLSKLIHVVAEGFPATRENKPHCASPFPVSACVIFPNVPLAPASHEAKPESLLAGPSRGCGYRVACLLHLRQGVYLVYRARNESSNVVGSLCLSPSGKSPGMRSHWIRHSAPWSAWASLALLLSVTRDSTKA